MVCKSYRMMADAVIVSGARSAVGKAPAGTLRDVPPVELAAAAIGETLRRAPQIKPEDIEDVILGCAMPEAEQGLNVARIASFRAGLPVTVPALTVNRFCASGLQSIAFAAERIRLGSAETIIAGGVESMSLVPMGGNKFSANPHLAEHFPEAYISMGLTGERVAQKYGVSREEQDAFSYASHRKALKAAADGKFKEEIFPLEIVKTVLDENGKKKSLRVEFAADEGPRPDTSLEKLAQLKPAFKENGTITAGSASQMSDGAAAVLVTSSENAKRLGMKPLGRFVAYAVAGVPPDLMGIGPVEAVPKALKQAGLSLGDIGLIELNEAFAAQAFAVIKLAGFNPDIVNVNGGAIALGHPLGCTGTKLTLTLLFEMRRRGVRYGMVTACIGGGMGAAGIFEIIP